MRLQYRKENGLTPDIVDDVEIENMIREEKIGETYGAPVVDNEFVRDAGRFSEDMRFQTKPGKRNPGKPLYNTIDNSFVCTELIQIWGPLRCADLRRALTSKKHYKTLDVCIWTLQE